MAYSRHAAVLLVGLALLVFSTVICGCGGGAASPLSELPATGGGLAVRSVSLNNYNNWTPPRPERSDYSEQVALLAKRNRVCMTEFYSWRSGLTPDALRRLNPNIKVYRVYSLCAKNTFDPDSRDGDPLSGVYMQTPISYQQIVRSDWWLRDGNGEIIKENDSNSFLDVGKPGLKEMMLANMLSRLEGKGYDGVVIDYHLVNQGMYSRWVTGAGLPAPEAYPDERQWFEKAAKPMAAYVINGLRNRGYEVVANCAGEMYNDSPESQWLRSILDGSVYELWALDSDTSWASQSDVEMRIRSFLDDNLEAWTADFGLRGPGCIRDSGPDPEYERKFLVGLALYYIGLPQSPALQAKRSYGHYKNSEVHWEPLWDFAIGDPSALPDRMPEKYFWSRKYTQGLVLLNYEHSEAITYPLDRAYRTPKGAVVTNSVTLQPHTALILAVQ